MDTSKSRDAKASSGAPAMKQATVEPVRTDSSIKITRPVPLAVGGRGSGCDGDLVRVRRNADAVGRGDNCKNTWFPLLAPVSVYDVVEPFVVAMGVSASPSERVPR